MQHECKRMPLHVRQPQEIMHALAHLSGGHPVSGLPTKQSIIFWLCIIRSGVHTLILQMPFAKSGRRVRYNKSQQNTVFKRVRNHRPVITFSPVRMLTGRLPARTLAYCRERAFL